MTPLAIALILVALVGGAVVGFFIGQAHRKKVAEATIGSANQEATRIINQALTTAEQKKKEAILEAKDEIHKTRTETERELRERRTEVQRQERRNIQREENLDKKTATLEKREEKLNQKLKEAEAKEEEVEALKKSQLEILEKISGLSEAQAREQILSQVDERLDREKASRIMEAQEQIKERSDELAKEIVTIAIQRCAAERTTDATVSVVSLPNDEMKGRIIGREGRNIRAIETVTGVDLIIDDTPETITISCFEPVRREVARLTVERLIQDGRIHPARIEETYEKAKREVNQTIKQTGERAVLDAGVTGLHPELIKLLGKLRYRTSYGQNVLDHSLEVCYIAGLIASELGADVKQARRAGLLHDIGKALDHEFEGSHVTLGADAAKKYRESEAVVHAIKAHPKRRPPSPSSYRRPMPSPPPVPAPAARTSRTTSNVWRNSKRSPTPMTESRTLSPSRQAVRSVSSSNRRRSTTIRWSSSRMTSLSGSRAKWNIPDRSRSMSSGRAA